MRRAVNPCPTIRQPVQGGFGSISSSFSGLRARAGGPKRTALSVRCPCRKYGTPIVEVPAFPDRIAVGIPDRVYLEPVIEPGTGHDAFAVACEALDPDVQAEIVPVGRKP